jgi:hypothetical protein
MRARQQPPGSTAGDGRYRRLVTARSIEGSPEQAGPREGQKMSIKATKKVSRGRTTAAKTFTRNDNQGVQARRCPASMNAMVTTRVGGHLIGIANYQHSRPLFPTPAKHPRSLFITQGKARS